MNRPSAELPASRCSGRVWSCACARAPAVRALRPRSLFSRTVACRDGRDALCPWTGHAAIPPVRSLRDLAGRDPVRVVHCRTPGTCRDRRCRVPQGATRPAASWRTRGNARGRPRRARLLLVGVPRVGGDLVGHRPHRPDDLLAVRGLAQEELDPGVGPVVRRHIVLHEQLAEGEPDADVGERLEREQAARPRDEGGELGVGRDDLVDDGADRLVDEREPELIRRGHGRSMP